MKQWPRKIAIGLITLYQRTLSPDHSWLGKWFFPLGHCKYQPSCSDYARQALRQYGFIRGTGKTLWRLLRCNPWSAGGADNP